MKPPAPRVSIVLPVYNGERFLAESVRSIQSQTFVSWELILVDDASTDQTVAMTDAMAKGDARIRVLHNDRNRKLPASLNAGFAQARGAYLTWTSDDNRYHPRALETMVSALDCHPNADIVYASCYTIDETGSRTGRRRARPPSWIYCHNVVGACFLYRASLSKTLGDYEESLFLMEDWEFWLRAARVGRFHRISHYLYDYRCHGQSLTATHLRNIVETHLRVLDHALTHTHAIPTRIIARSRLYMAMGAYKIGNTSEAKAQLARVLPQSRGWYGLIRLLFCLYRLKRAIHPTQ